jgi:multiple sugar transport system substrate-binding protein
MKKTLTTVAATALLATAALTGCSGGDTTTSPTTASGGDAATSAAASTTTEITYWFWQDDATDPTWQNLADEFNASQSEVKVTMESYPLDQYQNQLITATMNGTGPDAARTKDWWLGQLAPEGVLAPLDAYIDAWSGKADVVPGLWDSGRLPGDSTVYTMPHQYTTLYLYYRKDLFAAAGLEAPKTQQDLLDAAKALTGGDQYGIDVRGGSGGQDQWLAWMFAGGADVVDSSGAVVLDNATAVEVNQRYLDIVIELGAAPPGSITAAFADVKTNFAAGVTAMMIHHPGSLAEMRQQFGDNLGVIPIPTADGKAGATLGTMSGNVIMSASDKKDAAWKWISWLCEEGPMTTISDSPQGQLPVLQSVIDTDTYTADEGLVVATTAIATAKTWPALAGVAELASKEWNPTIQDAFQGKLTSQEALTKMADVLKAGA